MATLPNMLIVGAQKAGTTWLHHNLKKSRHFFGSENKELSGFNHANYRARLEDYARNFEEAGEATYVFESTPAYFDVRYRRTDPARNIADTLEDPRIIVILRDPIDRYESAMTHHMMREKIPYTPVIDEVTNRFNAHSFGFYARILAHWRAIFPNMGVFFYDDLQRDPVAFMQSIFDHLGVENDLDPEIVGAKLHYKEKKAKKLGGDWVTLPRLSPRVRRQLKRDYAADTAELGRMTGRDLSHWLQTPGPVASAMISVSQRLGGLRRGA